MDPEGLYEWGASLGGDAEDSKVSETIRKRRQAFRDALAGAKGQLDTIKNKYGEKSSEYTKAKAAVDAYGQEGVSNKVVVGVVADNQQTHTGHTAVSGRSGNIYVTFKQGYVDSVAAPGADKFLVQSFAGLAAHEGMHGSDAKSGKKLDTYESEYDGLFVDAVIGEAQNPSGWNAWPLGSGAAAKRAYAWNSSWGAVDSVRTNRDTGVRTVLEAPVKDGGYGFKRPKT